VVLRDWASLWPNSPSTCGTSTTSCTYTRNPKRTRRRCGIKLS